MVGQKSLEYPLYDSRKVYQAYTCFHCIVCLQSFTTRLIKCDMELGVFYSKFVLRNTESTRCFSSLDIRTSNL